MVPTALRHTSWRRYTVVAFTCLGTSALAQSSPTPRVTIVQGGEAAAQASALRQTIVSAKVNPPDSFPGWGGSVAWNGVARLKDGTLLVAFNAGYWHVSPPSGVPEIQSSFPVFEKGGMRSHFDAPTGGRLMLTRSVDGGKHWSKPETLVDSKADDRAASLLSLPDGSVLCSWFTSYGGWVPWSSRDSAFSTHMMISRSTDDGRTWSTPRRVPSPFAADASDGPMTLLNDGSILMTEYGWFAQQRPPNVNASLAVLRSSDNGTTWTTLSTLSADHTLTESSTAVLPDGKWVIVARDLGDVSWSTDQGKHWTPPTSFGMPMMAPELYVLPDGTLVALYGHSGLRMTFSTDDGKTWIVPAANSGFVVDRAVYGYGAATVLPDGTLYVVYQNTPSFNQSDINAQALYAIRVRVRPDHSGIDLLPPITDSRH